MKLDFLAFGAHPDDVELFCGGTLAKMAALGYETGIVDMSRGELGSRGSAAIRAREAKAAAECLKVRIRKTLTFPDGRIEATPAARLKIIRILRQYRPSVVAVHYWDDRHPDHVHTSRLVAEAAHHSGLAKIDTGQERFRPTAIIYFKLPHYVLPSFIVDISDQMKVKMEAVGAYGSQLFDPASFEPTTYLSKPDFLLGIRSIHAYYGYLVGRAAGEAFYTRGLLDISDPVEFFKTQHGTHFR
jgi:bacillithiol biosynthesis deacetylase BshB1